MYAQTVAVREGASREATSPWTTVNPLGIWKFFQEGEVRVEKQLQ